MHLVNGDAAVVLRAMIVCCNYTGILYGIGWRGNDKLNGSVFVPVYICNLYPVGTGAYVRYGCRSGAVIPFVFKITTATARNYRHGACAGAANG